MTCCSSRLSPLLQPLQLLQLLQRLVTTLCKSIVCAVVVLILVVVVFCAVLIRALHVLKHRCQAGISDLSV
jgi:fumarate reductase subunit D